MSKEPDNQQSNPRPSRHYRNDDNVWSDYVKVAKEYDDRMLLNLSTNLDVVLVFAGLFTSIITNFLVDAKRSLEEDYSQTTAQLLRVLIDPTQPMPPPFEPDNGAVALNAVWYVSLLLSILASVGAMVSKMWLSAFDGHHLVGDLGIACNRQKRFEALKKWHVTSCVTACYTLLYTSIIFFLSGLLQYWDYSEIVPISLVFYLILAILFSVSLQVRQMIQYCRPLKDIYKAQLLSFVSSLKCCTRIIDQAFKGRGVKRSEGKEDSSYNLWHVDVSPETQVKALVWLLQRPLAQDRLIRVLKHIRDLCSRTDYIPLFTGNITRLLIFYIRSLVDNGITTDTEREAVSLCMVIIARIQAYSFFKLQQTGELYADMQLEATIGEVLDSNEVKDPLLSHPDISAASLWMQPYNPEYAMSAIHHIETMLQRGDNSSESVLLELIQGLRYNAYVSHSHHSSNFPLLPVLDQANAIPDTVARSMLAYSIDVVNSSRQPSPVYHGWESMALPALVEKVLRAIENHPNDGDSHRGLFVFSWLLSLVSHFRQENQGKGWAETHLVNVAIQKLKEVSARPMRCPSASDRFLPLTSLTTIYDTIIHSKPSSHTTTDLTLSFLQAYEATVQCWFTNGRKYLSDVAFTDISRSINSILSFIVAREDDSSDECLLAAVYTLSLITFLFPDRLDYLIQHPEPLRNALYNVLTTGPRNLPTAAADETQWLCVQMYSALSLSKLGMEGLPGNDLCMVVREMSSVYVKSESSEDKLTGSRVKWMVPYVVSIICEEVERSDESLHEGGTTPYVDGHVNSTMDGKQDVFRWYEGFPLLRHFPLSHTVQDLNTL